MARRMFTRNLKSTHVKATISYMEEEEIVAKEMEFTFTDMELKEPSKIKKLIRKEINNREALIQLNTVEYTESNYGLPIDDFCCIARLYDLDKDKYTEAIQEVKEFINDVLKDFVNETLEEP